METRPRTILRVKRLRTEEPLPFLRLQTSADAWSAQYPSSSTNKRSRVLWKRVEASTLSGKEDAESYRIVHAKLENFQGDDDVENQPQSKRRKLTLTMGQTVGSLQQPKKNVYKVLDPVSRMVDDSLQQVHQGMKSVSQHYQWVISDPALYKHQQSYNPSKPNKWLVWNHSSGGNLLHACALWNDVEVAAELLQTHDLASSLCEAIDEDGRTPYEVAQLSGHTSICEVLEAFGGDTTNYVHDLFFLDDQDDGEECIESDTDGTSNQHVELASGVAFWNTDGELVIEPQSDKVRNALTANLDDDSEYDSNCEDYDANDYPDEEYGDEGVWGYDDAVDPYDTYNQYAANPEDDVMDLPASCALDRQYALKTPNMGDDADDFDYDEYD
eukprot:Nitzschia sp. Nitz4//scaffold77_size91520//55973//57127//NITZ4_004895-RA/size91520-processed-gene-0.35-mRNA-1//1//CDS//3329558006//8161//frame0